MAELATKRNETVTEFKEPAIKSYGLAGVHDESSDHIHDIMSEIINGTPRACAILGGVLIDQRLKTALMEHLRKQPQKIEMILSERASLSNFGAKIDFGRKIELYSDVVRNELNLIRKIRNQFDHRFDLKEFSDSPVKDWCNSFSLCDKYCAGANERDRVQNSNKGKPITEWEFWVWHDSKTELLRSPRTRFIVSLQVMYFVLDAVGAGHQI